MDVHSKEIRRKNMQAIQGKNTSPELAVRRMLFSQGFRYRLHVSKLPGTPDILLPKYRTVVLIQGCFWHSHGCHLCKIPKTRTEFWQDKIEKNRQRDIKNYTALENLGWRVIVIWECALKGKFRWEADNLCTYLKNIIQAPEQFPNSQEITYQKISED